MHTKSEWFVMMTPFSASVLSNNEVKQSSFRRKLDRGLKSAKEIKNEKRKTNWDKNSL